MKYSVIVPVYNRPDEVDELLESLCSQTFKDFEVVIVEDGSQIPCKDVCDKYADILDLHYYFKQNSGPGQSRNYGVERAQGEYVIILDSDAVVPTGFLQAVDDELQRQPSDAWGGPDAAHESFTDIQKAISYAMTSFFTTGGIRGGKKQLDKFYPRSFNMGVRREAYLALGGFSPMRFSKMSLYGEDIDFSIRIYKAGYSCRLFPEAWVWHKRRTDFRKFWRQVYNSGIARINLWKKYPEALKPVHALPSVFTLGTLGLLVLAPFTCGMSLLPLALYVLLIFIDSTIRNKSLKVGLISIPAVFVQLIGYGVGFLESWWKNCDVKHG
ncbi:MAG: glycosyltransferase [Prevotella sp.]|nr:glycosyltransferase [Prevotella sp.]